MPNSIGTPVSSQGRDCYQSSGILLLLSWVKTILIVALISFLRRSEVEQLLMLKSTHVFHWMDLIFICCD